MVVFPAGERGLVLARVNDFVERMDREGHGYGHSGIEQLDAGTDASDPHAPFGEPHAIVILEGEGWVVGGEGVRTEVVAGQGVWWSADEPWDINCDTGSMAYVEVEGSELLPADLSTGRPGR